MAGVFLWWVFVSLVVTFVYHFWWLIVFVVLLYIWRNRYGQDSK